MRLRGSVEEFAAHEEDGDGTDEHEEQQEANVTQDGAGFAAAAAGWLLEGQREVKGCGGGVHAGGRGSGVQGWGGLRSVDTVRDVMRILGIESSCDETAAAVVRDGVEVLSSVVSSQVLLHEAYAGVVPEIASRAHVERLVGVVRGALEGAGMSMGEVDAVAVGNRPGLIGCLLVGVAGAKALAWSLGKPLIGVDHVGAHLYSGVFGGGEVAFPAVGLVVSGGHTSLYRLESWTRVERLGGTIDDALGEAYDKVAKILGVGYPGGPNIDRLAQEAGADDRAYALPVSRLGGASLDFSFSGLKTAVLYAARGVPGQRVEDGSRLKEGVALTEQGRRNLAASFQRAATAAVVLKVERALEQAGAGGGGGAGVRTLLTGGGVTANSRLRAGLIELSRRRGVTLFLPKMEYCVDNAAMIAGLGTRLYEAGQVSGMELGAEATTGLQ